MQKLGPIKAPALYDLDKHDEANESLKLCVFIFDPKFCVAWNNKGNALYKLDKLDEAIKAYKNALEVDPKYAEAWTRGRPCSY